MPSCGPVTVHGVVADVVAHTPVLYMPVSSKIIAFTPTFATFWPEVSQILKVGPWVVVYSGLTCSTAKLHGRSDGPEGFDTACHPLGGMLL